jgi:hypothetical protein
MRRLWWIVAPVVVGAVVAVAFLVPTPSATTPSAPATTPAPPTSSGLPATLTYPSPQTFAAELAAAGLPLLPVPYGDSLVQQQTYTETVVAELPCESAAEGESWDQIIGSLDDDLGVNPIQYGKMVTVGIRVECPKYVTLIPTQ